MKMKMCGTVLLFIQMISCFAMDDPRDANTFKSLVAHVGGQIDKQILGITDSAWYTPMVGSCASFYKSFSFTNNPDEAHSQLSKVELVIQEATNNHQWHSLLFETLHKNHWHFAYLVNAMVKSEVGKLHQITGSTIDDMLNTCKQIRGLSSLLSTFIHERAQECYAQEVGLDKSLFDIHFGGANGDQDEIHFAALEAVTHEPRKLVMYDNGKYIRSIAPWGQQGFWDTATAMETDKDFSSFKDDKQCFAGTYLINADESVLAMCGDPDKLAWRLRLIVKKYRQSHRDAKRAMLFVRPTLTSWLCQQAYLRNKDNKKELNTLYDSNAVKSIQGFPKTNLLGLIHKVILDK